MNCVGLVSWHKFDRKWIDWVIILTLPALIFVWWDYFRAREYQADAALYIAASVAWVEKIWRYCVYKRQKWYALGRALALVIAAGSIASAVVALVQHTAWLVFTYMMCQALWYMGVAIFDLH